MTIESIARKDVVTVNQETPVREIARTMAEEQVGSVVVVTGGDVPVGIVTDRDLVLDVFGTDRSTDGMTARDVMTPDPFTVERDTGVFDATSAMCEHGVRRMPVVDDGALVGIVTFDDVFVLLATELSDLAGVVIGESPPYESAASSA